MLAVYEVCSNSIPYSDLEVDGTDALLEEVFWGGGIGVSQKLVIIFFFLPFRGRPIPGPRLC